MLRTTRKIGFSHTIKWLELAESKAGHNPKDFENAKMMSSFWDNFHKEFLETRPPTHFVGRNGEVVDVNHINEKYKL